MSNTAITWAFGIRDLKSGTKFVLITLADLADQEYSCSPSIAELATLTGSSAAAVRTHIRALVRADLVHMQTGIVRHGPALHNLYRLAVVESRTKDR